MGRESGRSNRHEKDRRSRSRSARNHREKHRRSRSGSAQRRDNTSHNPVRSRDGSNSRRNETGRHHSTSSRRNEVSRRPTSSESKSKHRAGSSNRRSEASHQDSSASSSKKTVPTESHKERKRDEPRKTPENRRKRRSRSKSIGDCRSPQKRDHGDSVRSGDVSSSSRNDSDRHNSSRSKNEAKRRSKSKENKSRKRRTSTSNRKSEEPQEKRDSPSRKRANHSQSNQKRTDKNSDKNGASASSSKNDSKRCSSEQTPPFKKPSENSKPESDELSFTAKVLSVHSYKQTRFVLKIKKYKHPIVGYWLDESREDLFNKHCHIVARVLVRDDHGEPESLQIRELKVLEKSKKDSKRYAIGKAPFIAYEQFFAELPMIGPAETSTDPLESWVLVQCNILQLKICKGSSTIHLGDFSGSLVALFTKAGFEELERFCCVKNLYEENEDFRQELMLRKVMVLLIRIKNVWTVDGISDVDFHDYAPFMEKMLQRLKNETE